MTAGQTGLLDDSALQSLAAGNRSADSAEHKPQPKPKTQSRGQRRKQQRRGKKLVPFRNGQRQPGPHQSAQEWREGTAPRQRKREEKRRERRPNACQGVPGPLDPDPYPTPAPLLGLQVNPLNMEHTFSHVKIGKLAITTAHCGLARLNLFFQATEVKVTFVTSPLRPLFLRGPQKNSFCVASVASVAPGAS